MFLHVVSAEYVEDYKIEILFNNGSKGIANLDGTLNGTMFNALRKKSEFKKFEVNADLETVVWSNGADLAPEYLYFQAFKDDLNLQSQFKQWGYIT